MTEDKKDERVVLFVKLDPGEKLTQEMVQAIKQEIRVRRSARHVPCSVSHLNFSRCPAPPYHGPRNRIGEPSATAATSARSLPLVVARDLPRVLESWVIWINTAMHHPQYRFLFCALVLFPIFPRVGWRYLLPPPVLLFG